MKRTETTYLNATINAVRTSARRHDPVTATLDVAELASIAMHTDKPRLRTKAMRALLEASTTRNPASRFAALEALERSYETEAEDETPTTPVASA